MDFIKKLNYNPSLSGERNEIKIELIRNGALNSQASYLTYIAITSSVSQFPSELGDCIIFLAVFYGKCVDSYDSLDHTAQSLHFPACLLGDHRKSSAQCI